MVQDNRNDSDLETIGTMAAEYRRLQTVGRTNEQSGTIP